MRPTNSVKLNLEELNARLNPSTLSFASGVVFYIAGSSEANVVAITGGSGSVTITDTGVSSIAVDSSAVPYVSGSGNSLTFTGSFSYVWVMAGDQGDSLGASGFSSSATLFMDGEDGSDTLTGSGGADQLSVDLEATHSCATADSYVE